MRYMPYATTAYLHFQFQYEIKLYNIELVNSDTIRMHRYRCKRPKTHF